MAVRCRREAECTAKARWGAKPRPPAPPGAGNSVLTPTKGGAERERGPKPAGRVFKRLLPAREAVARRAMAEGQREAPARAARSYLSRSDMNDPARAVSPRRGGNGGALVAPAACGRTCDMSQVVAPQCDKQNQDCPIA